VTGSVEEIIEAIKQKGHDKALLIGGGTTNASFLNANAIDEMILSVHPLILGNGIKLFESKEVEIKLSLISEVKLEEDLIQERYKLLK
jgi:dihydrofolate reductase